MADVRATLVVDFTGDENASDDGLLQLEIDDREDGKNGGQTSGFRPGDNVYYLLYKSSGVNIINHVTTDGAIGKDGSDSRLIVDEAISFDNSREISLRYPAAGGFALTWQGSQFDAQGNAASLSASLVDQNKVRLDKPGYGLALVTYTTAFEVFRLHSVTAKRAKIIVFGKT